MNATLIFMLGLNIVIAVMGSLAIAGISYLRSKGEKRKSFQYQPVELKRLERK